MSDSILSRLRTETAEAHTSLENQVGIEKCLADVEQYRDLLVRFHGFYAAMETQLESVGDWSTVGLDLTERRKAAWITSDLAALGADAATAPACDDLAPLPGLGHAFGGLYVLEGSTLGGRAISNMMQGSAVPENARRFFAGYETETGPKWKAFGAALEQYVADSGQGDDVIAGANAVFASMERWMQKTAA